MLACALFLPQLVRAPPCFPSAWEGREGDAEGEKKMWAGRMKENTRKNNIKCHETRTTAKAYSSSFATATFISSCVLCFLYCIYKFIVLIYHLPYGCCPFLCSSFTSPFFPLSSSSSAAAAAAAVVVAVPVPPLSLVNASNTPSSN